MIGDYWKLAVGNLRHRGVRSWLTLLGIFIGIMAVVALISLGSGLKMAVGAQFGISTTEVVTIQAGGLNNYGPPGSGAINPLTKEDVDAISRVGSVERAIARHIESGMLEYNNKIIYGYATNVPEEKSDYEFMYDSVGFEIEQGRLLDGGDYGNVVLGNNFFTDNVGLERAVRVGDNVVIEERKFKVVGILKKKGSFIWDNIVLMKENTLEDLFETGESVDVIVAHVKDSDYMDKAVEDITKVMRKQRDVDIGDEDFEVSTPEATLETVNSVLNGIQIFIAIIAGISIFVGALGIVNTMTTSVLERQKEIGIMKAIGAKNSQIFIQFLIESGLLGLVGGLAGVSVGVLIGYFGTIGIGSWIGSEIKPSIDFVLIISALVGSFVVGAVAGIVPAMNASRQDPVEVIR